jgi:hypothetical protein
MIRSKVVDKIVTNYERSIDLFRFGRMTVQVWEMKELLGYIKQLEGEREDNGCDDA